MWTSSGVSVFLQLAGTSLFGHRICARFCTLKQLGVVLETLKCYIVQQNTTFGSVVYFVVKNLVLLQREIQGCFDTTFEIKTYCCLFVALPPEPGDMAAANPSKFDNDWVFLNYTYKRFEGLTQRGHLRPESFHKMS